MGHCLLLQTHSGQQAQLRFRLTQRPHRRDRGDVPGEADGGQSGPDPTSVQQALVGGGAGLDESGGAFQAGTLLGDAPARASWRAAATTSESRTVNTKVFFLLSPVIPVMRLSLTVVPGVCKAT